MTTESDTAAPAFPTLEDWQHWTLVMGRAQQMLDRLRGEQKAQALSMALNKVTQVTGRSLPNQRANLNQVTKVPGGGGVREGGSPNCRRRDRGRMKRHQFTMA